jgi:hypothetical protein
VKYVGFSVECCEKTVHLRFSEVDFCINASGWFKFVCPYCRTDRTVRIKSCVARVEADAVNALPTTAQDERTD